MARLSRAERRARSERRSAILLIVVSAVFVLIGLGMIVSGEPVAIVVVLFFSACGLAGFMRLPTMSPQSGLRLAIAGSTLFAAACAGILALAVMGMSIDSPTMPSTALTVVAAVGLVFFGGGAILLTVMYRRNRRDIGRNQDGPGPR